MGRGWGGGREGVETLSKISSQVVGGRYSLSSSLLWPKLLRLQTLGTRNDSLKQLRIPLEYFPGIFSENPGKRDAFN